MWHLHDFIGARPVVAKALHRAAADPSLGIAVSNAVARDAEKVLPGVSIETVYNVVDVARFSPQVRAGQLLDELAGLPPAETNTTRIVLVATYARWKGHDVFLQAAAKALAHPGGQSMRFYIVGGPIYRTAGSQFSRDELIAEARRLGIADRVGFIEFQQDTARIYRAADIVVHASTHPEPFGLTIVEAMACGRATIVSNAGGASELFTSGEDAIGFEPGNATALADVIVMLARDPGNRNLIGERAAKAAQARFHPGGLPEKVKKIYGRTMAEHA